jgi:SAM-dependent methyltransferase
MKKVLYKINFLLNLIGFYPIKFFSYFNGLPFYFRDYKILKKQLKIKNDFTLKRSYPVLNERFRESGTINGHYFHQDLLIARKIYENNPLRHIDIGSRIDGFVAHVASFREIEVFDIRSIKRPIKNILFKQADLMQLPDNMHECCDSISTLHAIEHFGLGRYGDPIDIDGHIHAINNLYWMLKPNGKFYFSVPIGKQRIEFNAHRVFSVRYLLELIKDNFTLNSFSFVDDNGDFFENVELTQIEIDRNYGCHYGCGIFELTKN